MSEIREAPSGNEVAGLFGVEIKKRGNGECFLSQCPYCNHEDPKFTGTTSYNERKHVFRCLAGGCGASSGWMKLMRDFGFLADDAGGSERDRERKPKPRRDDAPWSRAKERIASRKPNPRSRPSRSRPKKGDLTEADLKEMQSRYVARMRCTDSEAYEYLESERGLDEDTVEHFGFGEDERGNLTIPYWDEAGRLIGFKYRVIDPESDVRYLKVAGRPHSRMYGVDKLDKSVEHVTIVEGELDAASLDQIGLENVVSLPNGASSWKKKWAALFEDYRQVFIGVDDDEAAEKSALDIISDIGPQKCTRLYFYHEGAVGKTWKDANEALVKGKLGADRLEELLAASKIFVGNPIDWIGNVVKEKEFVPTLYPRMDKILGGFPTGEISFLVGKPGSGKSTWANDVALNLAQSRERVGILSFDMSPKDYSQGLVAMCAGMRYTDWREMGPRDIRDTMADYRSWVGNRIEIVGEHPEVAITSGYTWRIKTIIEHLRRTSEEDGTRVFFVDHFMSILDRARKERPPRESIGVNWILDAVGEFMAAARRFGIHISFINHMKEGRGGGHESQFYGSLLEREASNVWKCSHNLDDDGKILHTVLYCEKIRFRRTGDGNPSFGFAMEKGRLKEVFATSVAVKGDKKKRKRR